MADVYATIAAADVAVQQRLVEVLELRAADPQQAAMRETFLAAIDFPADARVLEVGCGSGIVTRAIAMRPGVLEVTGIDPSLVFLKRAREFANGVGKMYFLAGDGRTLDLPDSSFDTVIAYTVLTHVPEPDRAIAEAYRVLKPSGTLAVFDGDYATTTVAKDTIDPLQCCVDAAMAALVHDRWLARRLPALIADAGFTEPRTASYGYVAADNPDYPLSLVDRGADALVAAGTIGDALAAELKVEARRRVEAGRFFGHIAYFSLIARKPGQPS